MPLQVIHSTDDRPLQDIADALVRSRKVVVIAGAGISTSCGIPDFRSKDGLYSLIPAQGLMTPPPSIPSTPSRKRKGSQIEDDGFPSSQDSTTSNTSQRSSASTRLRGQDLFDARVWKDPATTETFYRFISSLRMKVRDEVSETSLAHKFIRTLRDGGRLVRCYTQNIDGLESREGLCADLSRGKGCKRRFMRQNFEVPRPHVTINTEFDGGCEVVPLHGELSTVRCALCQRVRYWSEEDTTLFLEGEAPTCDFCSRKSDDREARGKRGVAVGLMRPNVILYGEEHPHNELLAPLVPFDISLNPEVLIVMGTSLKVFGLQKIVRDFAKAIHGRKDKKGKVIFVNRTSPAESIWDGVIDQYVAMDCDDWIKNLRERREELWLRQGELDLKLTKPIAKRKRSSESAEERPAKKAKTTLQKIISVHIPRREPISSNYPETSRPADKLNVAAMANETTGQDSSLTATTPATPCRPRQWKRNMHDNPLEALDSPEHPTFSPLRKSFKPLIFTPDLPVSPERPAYSPLRKSFNTSNSGSDLPMSPERLQYPPMNTPSRSHLRNVIYANSDERRPQVDQEQEKSSIVSQLQKRNALCTLISNVGRVRELLAGKDRNLYWSKIRVMGEILARDDDKENQML